MSFPELLYRFVGFSGFLVSALVCVLAVKAYQDTHKRSLFMIAVAAGLSAVIGLLPELGAGGRTWWYLHMVMRLVGDALWLVGCWLVFQDYTRLITNGVQSAAPSDSGLAAPADPPAVREAPPSASQASGLRE